MANQSALQKLKKKPEEILQKNVQIAGTHNPEDNMLRREYEAMRTEAKWADALRPTK